MKYMPTIAILLIFAAWAWASDDDFKAMKAEAGHQREIMLKARAERDADNREYKRLIVSSAKHWSVD